MSRAIVIASGPSLTLEDCELVRANRSRIGYRVIVVNSTFKRCPWADVCYFADLDWLTAHVDELRSRFQGAIWTGDREAARHWPALVCLVNRVGGRALPPSGQGICTGGTPGNSGYQALAMAAQHGATEILLLGFDHRHTEGRTHWHEDHPAPLGNAVNPAGWVELMNDLSRQLLQRGVSVQNASRDTALTCFPRVALEEVIR